MFCTWGLAFSVWGLYQKKSLALSTKKNNLKVSVPNVGTGGLKKILTVSVLYMGFSVERLGSFRI